MIEFFLGGARSGKSSLAEQSVLASGKERVYLATAEAGDGEMAKRIQRHQQDRGDQWLTLEEPLQLTQTLRRECHAQRCILVDCLTLWLSNWLGHNEEQWAAVKADFFEALPLLPGDIVFVSNEVGQGIVPANALARKFVDESGWLHQALVEHCDRAHFVVAGIPIKLKEK